MRMLAISTAALLTLSPVTPATAGTPAPPACIDGTSRSFSAIEALQTYEVPLGATALLITVNGASGGGVFLGCGPNTCNFLPGGLGAHITAVVPLSVLVGTLLVVVGSAGEIGDSGGAGGGGSFVFTLEGTLLMAAGGGGGLGNAQLGTSGADGSGTRGGLGGTSGSGGGGG